jgi:hypothetical protein
MKYIPLEEFSQVFSRRLDDRPTHAWCIKLTSIHHGISGVIIDECNDRSAGWAGWGFMHSGTLSSESYLFFEQKEDAAMTKLMYGSELYAN